MALTKWYCAFSNVMPSGSNRPQCQIFQGLERQVRIDRAGAIADQQREVHHLARLAGFDNQRYLRARAFADQVVVHGRQRQQAGNGGVIVVDAAVRQNQDVVAGLDRDRSAPAQRIERALQPLCAIRRAEQGGDGGGQEIALRDAAQLSRNRGWSEWDAAASACGSASAFRPECCARARCS